MWGVYSLLWDTVIHFYKCCIKFLSTQILYLFILIYLLAKFRQLNNRYAVKQ